MFSEAFYKNTTNLTRFIFFWDPDLMHAFVTGLVSQSRSQLNSSALFFGGAYKIVTREAAKGVSVDVEHLTVHHDSFFFA